VRSELIAASFRKPSSACAAAVEAAGVEVASGVPPWPALLPMFLQLEGGDCLQGPHQAAAAPAAVAVPREGEELVPFRLQVMAQTAAVAAETLHVPLRRLRPKWWAWQGALPGAALFEISD
jgi:hypothetical protein